MDNPRAEKVAVVTEVRERFDRAGAAILTEYRGLTVKDLATLRRSLRGAGGDYRIYKNTLVRFAAHDLGLDELNALLTGPTAIAFVNPAVDGRAGDAAEVAKTLRDYARQNPKLIVKGGVLGNKVMSAEDTNALADLPSREVILARLAGALAAPLQQFAGLLQAIPRSFAYGLKALIEQGGAGEGPVAAAEEAEPKPAEAPATTDAGEGADTVPPPTAAAPPQPEPAPPEPVTEASAEAPSEAPAAETPEA
jgi:large subunit ribosomal protein L10